MRDSSADPDSGLVPLHPHALGSDPEPDDSQSATRPEPVAPLRPTPGPHAAEQGTRQEPPRNPGAKGTESLPQIPGYAVKRHLGSGGMGSVYEATHCATGRTVALKLVNPSGVHDPQTRDRFDREVRTLAKFKHPNIVPLYDAGNWHGFPYYAMEFVPGGPLSDHLDRVRADLRGAVRLMVKVARAVAVVHGAGILHRDLKPLNVLLGPDDEPMVADFGLARRAIDESELTVTGQPIGTRVYMAPEQTRGRSSVHTAACDIWALGVTVYEVLTKSRPFADDGTTNLYARIRSEAAPPIEARFPTVPADLAAVVQKCLQKRPEDRYATADEVADELQRWLDDKPVLAPPVPEPPPAVVTPEPAKPYRRVRALVFVAVAVLLATGLGAGIVRRDTVSTIPPKKSLAERVAAGEKVKLTNEKGFPTVPLVSATRHEVGVRTFDGYRSFFSTTWGVAALADERWEQPIRVEGDVGVSFSTEGDARSGFYVGRRMWPGTELEHESLVYCALTPHIDNKNNEKSLAFSTGMYWWTNNYNGATNRFSIDSVPWSADRKFEGLRFAHVVVDVHPDEIFMKSEGVALKPVTRDSALKWLNGRIKSRPDVRQFTFTNPSFGTGIGVFCNADCVVANLTVSKLVP